MRTAHTLLAVTCLLLTGCGHLDNIPGIPLQTPEGFLQSQPWVKINLGCFSFIWSQPVSTVWVYGAGCMALYVAYIFGRKAGQSRVKQWWSAGLLLSGLGALLAGTSYQALGYEIKCHGRPFCTYTSAWEVAYLLLSVPAMNAFLLASAYSIVSRPVRKALLAYAFANTLGYTMLVLYGVWAEIPRAISFECMSLVSAPAMLFLLLWHSWGTINNNHPLHRTLLTGWLLFAGVGIAYSLYLGEGLSAVLWQQGIWFTENDVLHIGMIGWLYYLLKKVFPALPNGGGMLTGNTHPSET